MKVDGHFGDRTKQLVMKFQESAGMTADGVVTEHLWKKLVHSYEKIHKEEAVRRQRAKKGHHTNHRGAQHARMQYSMQSDGEEDVSSNK